MAALEKQRLRDLVNDYYHGLVSPESYRQQRAEILDNLGAAAPASDVTTPARPGQEPKTAAQEGADSSAATDTEPARSSGKSTSRSGVIGVIGLMLVAGAATVFFLRPQVSNVEQATQGQENASGAGLEAGDIILDDFLSRSDWSEESLNNLLVAWNALSGEQLENVYQGRRYRRLTSRLHQRIREEAALSTTARSRQFQVMTQFAAEIGAPYRESTDVSVAADNGTSLPPELPAEPAHGDEQNPPALQGIADAEVGGNESPDVDALAPEQAPAPQTAENRPVPVEAANPEAAGVDSAAPVPTAPEADPNDSCQASLAISRRPYCQDRLADGTDGPPLVVLPAGHYDMGSEANKSEMPVHRVTIDYPIAMSRDEVSVDEYNQFCASSGVACPVAPWSGGDHPVVSVSWEEAIRFAEWLTDQTGYRYRLPTEAEWEYAARAGTQTPYSFGDEVTPSAAHSSANLPIETPMPRSNRAVNRNPFRLYHMSGNVREWVQDDWQPNYDGAPDDGSARIGGAEKSAVIRGGSYIDSARDLRSAARHPLDRTHKDLQTGFRVVREVNSVSY